VSGRAPGVVRPEAGTAGMEIGLRDELTLDLIQPLSISLSSASKRFLTFINKSIQLLFVFYKSRGSFCTVFTLFTVNFRFDQLEVK